MRRALVPPVLAAGRALSGCADDSSDPGPKEAASTGFAQEVRDNFLPSDFEQRLLSGAAPEKESARLTGWSTECAEQAAQ